MCTCQFIDKDKRELLVRNEQTSQLICNNNNTDTNTCEVYINTKLYKIPGFHPLNIISQKRIAEKYGLEYYKNLTYDEPSNLNVKNCIPSRQVHTIGDGNCLFRAISQVLIGSEDNHLHIRHLITMNMTNSLHSICTKYLLSKIVYVESYYRNITQYINRSKMTLSGIGRPIWNFSQPQFYLMLTYGYI